ncbi:MAG: hypothetical protein LBM76_03035 [Mycoplasmataceae bacterium]|nr:hypothetical protein [Mycoplasmataceae bacterium]
MAQTRMEKWKSWRAEISDNSWLMAELSNESTAITDFKKRINKISPRILEGIQEGVPLSELVSINENKGLDVEQIFDFSRTIDDERAKILRDEIAEWTNSRSRLKIMDENGNVSKQWLGSDDDFKKLAENKEKIESSYKKLEKYKEDNLTSNANNNIDSKLNELDIQKNLELIKTIKPLPETETQTSSHKKQYLIFIACVIITIVVLISLAVAKLYI